MCMSGSFRIIIHKAWAIAVWLTIDSKEYEIEMKLLLYIILLLYAVQQSRVL